MRASLRAYFISGKHILFRLIKDAKQIFMIIGTPGRVWFVDSLPHNVERFWSQKNTDKKKKPDVSRWLSRIITNNEAAAESKGSTKSCSQCTNSKSFNNPFQTLYTEGRGGRGHLSGKQLITSQIARSEFEKATRLFATERERFTLFNKCPPGYTDSHILEAVHRLRGLCTHP